MIDIKSYVTKYERNVENLKVGGVNLSKVRCALEGTLDYILFGSTITDYFELAFWKRSFYEKSQYATWRLHKRFIYEVDDSAVISKLSDKATMYLGLAPFIRRDQLFTRMTTIDKFKEFCSRHDTFFYKPCGNSCGDGIEKICVEKESIDTLFHRLTAENAVLDTPITQHGVMNTLNSGSVNTIRIFTFRNNDIIYFTGAALRIGTDSFIDNYSAGGLVCSLNMKTGETSDEAENYLGQRFSKHPISGVELKGFHVPNWDDVLQYVFKMASGYELNYVAWDIAVQEDGPELVEANPGGMINVIQIAGAVPKKKLILKLENEWRNRKYDKADEYQMVLCE